MNKEVEQRKGFAFRLKLRSDIKENAIIIDQYNDRFDEVERVQIDNSSIDAFIEALQELRKELPR